MKHKHAEIIKAWADGAEIEIKGKNGWIVFHNPDWYDDYEYRVKPTPKPDVVKLYFVTPELLESSYFRTNLRLTFDGEGKLKAAEVIE
jgi:hypothetical protein